MQHDVFARFGEEVQNMSSQEFNLECSFFALGSSTVMCPARIPTLIPNTPTTILTHHQCAAFMIYWHYLCERKSQKPIRRNLSPMHETMSRTRPKRKDEQNQKPKKSDGRITIAFHKLIPVFSHEVAIYR